MGLRSGYFSDFGGVPTILFWGDANAIRHLARVLRELATGAGNVALNTLMQAADGRPIELKTMPQAEGMQVVEDRAGSRHLEWLLDRETMTDFAEMLDELADSDGPGHHYLESWEWNQLNVIAAKDEYPADLQPD